MVFLMLLVSIGACVSGSYVLVKSSHLYAEFAQVCPNTREQMRGLDSKYNAETMSRDPNGCERLASRLNGLGELTVFASFVLIAIGVLLFFTSPVMPFFKLKRVPDNE